MSCSVAAPSAADGSSDSCAIAVPSAKVEASARIAPIFLMSIVDPYITFVCLLNAQRGCPLTSIRSSSSSCIPLIIKTKMFQPKQIILIVSFLLLSASARDRIRVARRAGGDPHGLVWAHYDEDGNARVVRDQGGFHNGVNPAEGKPLLN